jgi:osmotically inducible protein OsmC
MSEAEQIRRASVRWSGNLDLGLGSVSADTSGAFRDLAVTWPSRTEAPEGRTSPEELLAAAHASCFSMALAGTLTREGTPPGDLSVSATVTFQREEGKWSVVSSHLDVRGRIEGLTQEGLADAAERAKENCPISRALKGNVALSVEATLEA